MFWGGTASASACRSPAARWWKPPWSKPGRRQIGLHFAGKLSPTRSWRSGGTTWGCINQHCIVALSASWLPLVCVMNAPVWMCDIEAMMNSVHCTLCCRPGPATMGWYPWLNQDSVLLCRPLPGGQSPHCLCYRICSRSWANISPRLPSPLHQSEKW